MGNRAPGVEKKFREFATPTMKPTTARAARPGEECWLIAACRGCWERTGPAPWTNLKLLSGVRQRRNGRRSALGHSVRRGANRFTPPAGLLKLSGDKGRNTAPSRQPAQPEGNGRWNCCVQE